MPKPHFCSIWEDYLKESFWSKEIFDFLFSDYLEKNQNPLPEFESLDSSWYCLLIEYFMNYHFSFLFFFISVFISLAILPYTTHIGLYGTFIAIALPLFFLNYAFLFFSLFSKYSGSISSIIIGHWFIVIADEILFEIKTDYLATSFAALTANIGFFSIMYTFSYFRGEPNIPRLIILIMYFILSMMVFVLAGNLMVLFFGWEMIGLTSFLLINYWINKIASLKSSLKALYFNRWSDLFILLFIASTYNFYYTADIDALIQAIANQRRFQLDCIDLKPFNLASAIDPIYSYRDVSPQIKINNFELETKPQLIYFGEEGIKEKIAFRVEYEDYYLSLWDESKYLWGWFSSNMYYGNLLIEELGTWAYHPSSWDKEQFYYEEIFYDLRNCTRRWRRHWFFNPDSDYLPHNLRRSHWRWKWSRSLRLFYNQSIRYPVKKLWHLEFGGRLHVKNYWKNFKTDYESLSDYNLFYHLAEPKGSEFFCDYFDSYSKEGLIDESYYDIWDDINNLHEAPIDETEDDLTFDFDSWDYEMYWYEYFRLKNLVLLGRVDILSIVFLSLLLGGGIKSAQFIGHLWLPDSMEAPVPASALIHSATLVSAGIYLIVRFNVVLLYLPEFSKFLLMWGGITSIFGGACACAQNDLKRILAYSTISHCGNMFILAGSGQTSDITVIYLYIHGYFKALSFLSVGNIIRFYKNVQDLRKMGMSAYYLPLDSLSLAIALINLGGLPFTLGYFLKQYLLSFVNIYTTDYPAWYRKILSSLHILPGKKQKYRFGLSNAYTRDIKIKDNKWRVDYTTWISSAAIIGSSTTGFMYCMRILFHVFFDYKKGSINAYIQKEHEVLISKYFSSTSFIMTYLFNLAYFNAYFVCCYYILVETRPLLYLRGGGGMFEIGNYLEDKYLESKMDFFAGGHIFPVDRVGAENHLLSIYTHLPLSNFYHRKFNLFISLFIIILLADYNYNANCRYIITEKNGALIIYSGVIAFLILPAFFEPLTNIEISWDIKLLGKKLYNFYFYDLKASLINLKLKGLSKIIPGNISNDIFSTEILNNKDLIFKKWASFKYFSN